MRAGSEMGLSWRKTTAIEGQWGGVAEAASLLGLSNDLVTFLCTEQTNVVSKKMADWLRYASIQQGVAQPSGGFFSNPRTRQVSVELLLLPHTGIF